jgi:serine/threonine-protein kinase RsbW
MSDYTFSYCSELASEDRMLDDLQQVLEQNGIEEGPARRLTLAVSEAFTNALLHGNDSQPEKKILLRLQVNEKVVVADITDEGLGGLTRIRERQGSDDPLAEGGRGIDLITRCGDRVEFSESPSGGLMVSVTVTRSQTGKTTIFS